MMEATWIDDIANLYLSQEKAAALISNDGQILYAKSDLGFETSGFYSLVEYSLKHIGLKPGEFLLTNDPYIGGTHLHRYTFVMPLTSVGNNTAGLILCLRREFSPNLSTGTKIDDEGLRIPPTPLFQGGVLSEPIIDAISGHPQCPHGFKEWITTTAADLSIYFQKWQQLHKNLNLQFSHAQIKKFLSFSQKIAMDKILEKTQGEGRSEVLLGTGETLKLRLEVRDGLVKADFGGTTSGILTYISDSTTFGAVAAALSEFYDFKLFKNSGTYSILQVTKPTGCFLNAKFPLPTQRGLQSGVAAIRLAMSLALRQVVKVQAPLETEGDLRLEIAFHKGQRWFSEWHPRSFSESFCLQKTESDYPVTFLKIEKNLEQEQILVEFKISEPAQMKWNSDFKAQALRVPPPWISGPWGTFEIKNDGDDWRSLGSQGTTDLKPGTHLKIQLNAVFAKH